ncbi:MAG: hypothetical protein LBV69_07920 [Bacteroidales bacterium]|jgi:peptidoglycan hydrolase CwlO-like protein|nr:hypothetical protein [Bacteroidales bacterium]
MNVFRPRVGKKILIILYFIPLGITAFSQKVNPEFDITFKDGNGNILVIDGFNRFCAAKLTTKDIFQLQTDNTNLQKNLNEANKTISNLDNKITQLNKEIYNFNNKISQLERDLSNLERKISDLERKIK